MYSLKWSESPPCEAPSVGVAMRGVPPWLERDGGGVAVGSGMGSRALRICLHRATQTQNRLTMLLYMLQAHGKS